MKRSRSRSRERSSHWLLTAYWRNYSPMRQAKDWFSVLTLGNAYEDGETANRWSRNIETAIGFQVGCDDTANQWTLGEDCERRQRVPTAAARWRSREDGPLFFFPRATASAGRPDRPLRRRRRRRRRRLVTAQSTPPTAAAEAETLRAHAVTHTRAALPKRTYTHAHTHRKENKAKTKKQRGSSGALTIVASQAAVAWGRLGNKTR